MQIDSERSLQREGRFGLGQAGIVNFPFMRFSRFVSQNGGLASLKRPKKTHLTAACGEVKCV